MMRSSLPTDPNDDLVEKEVRLHKQEMEQKMREMTRQAEQVARDEAVRNACMQAVRLAAQRLRSSPDLPLSEDELILCAIDGVLLARDLAQDQAMTPAQALASASAQPRAQARERLLDASWGNVPMATDTPAGRL